MKVLLTALLGLLMFAVPAGAAPGDETPQWVQQAVALKVPTYEKDVPAVVLVQDKSITIGSDGKITLASRRKVAPACSIPPNGNSGIRTMSYFGNGNR